MFFFPRLQTRGRHGNVALGIHGWIGTQWGWCLSYWINEAGQPLPASPSQREVSTSHMYWHLFCRLQLNFNCCLLPHCCCITFIERATHGLNGLKISLLGQVWKRCNVLSECQELHSLLPNSWGTKCQHPDELLRGDHSQSLGEYHQTVVSIMVQF